MSQLSEFFIESHTALGVFYPLHCIVAVFPDIMKARHVNRNLVFSGFPADQLAAFEGKEFLELEKQESGFWAHLMQAISQSIGGEQLATAHFLDFAEAGAAFLVVHCPTEELKAKA